MQKAVLAAGTAPPYLIEAVIVVVTASIVSYICFRMGLIPIIGFLLAGVLIGPHATKLVTSFELIDAAAEIGVILLLFSIGIEFSLEKLSGIKKIIFAGGGIQVLTAAISVMLILTLFGINWQAALFSGFLISLSSTAIVLKLLSDDGETSSEKGQVSLGILIFQDLAIIIMVLLIPVLGGIEEGPSGIFIALGKAVSMIFVVLFLARKVMPKILESVATTCSPELFILTVIAICFGTAFLTSLAGVSVSLGAFLAGLIVSESRFSQHAFSEIRPLQILFSAAFFVSVGMLLNLSFLLSNILIISVIITSILLIKVLTTGISIKSLGYSMPVVFSGSLILSQIGEFSFVLERAGRETGLTPAGMNEAGSQVFIASAVILMITTPLLSLIGKKIAAGIELKEAAKIPAIMEAELENQKTVNIQNHVIVSGYGGAAKKLTKILSGTGIPFIVLTLSPSGAAEAERDELNVIRGDSSRLVTLQHAGIEKAKMLLIADDDPAMAHRICSVARNFNPTLRIVIRTKYLADIEPLLNGGADKVIPEELESVVQMMKDVFDDYNISEAETEMHVAKLRNHDYEILRDEKLIEASPLICSDLDDSCLDTRIIRIREGMEILKKKFSQIDFSKEYNLNLKEIKRDSETVIPSGSFVLTAGDELVLEGPVHAFASIFPLLRNNNFNMEDLPDSKSDDKFKERQITLAPRANFGCPHLTEERTVIQKISGCEDCLKTGDSWVHLRICMTCGHVGCCDTSKNKHATKHFHNTGHPVIKSVEPGEKWGWCYIDEVIL